MMRKRNSIRTVVQLFISGVALILMSGAMIRYGPKLLSADFWTYRNPLGEFSGIKANWDEAIDKFGSINQEIQALNWQQKVDLDKLNALVGKVTQRTAAIAKLIDSMDALKVDYPVLKPRRRPISRLDVTD